jgi:cytochrome P450
MEREKEIRKLVNVLLQTARMAFQSEWTGSGSSDAAALCVDRYNRILVRLKEHEPEISAVFESLAPDCSLTTAAIACRQLASYFEDETGWSSRWKGAYASACDPKAFKDFWRKSARDVQDLGEYMRECAEEWARRRKAKGEGESTKDPASPSD